MSLRYKGIPVPGYNVQVDALRPMCFCRSRGAGVSEDSSKCTIHTSRHYNCGHHGCTCYDYRPYRERKYPNDWPMCICGHVAQDH